MSRTFDELPRKDYMGTISWSRPYFGAPQPMFGSAIKTSHPVCIRIDRANVICHGGDASDTSILPDNHPYIELEMTPLQWAEFLTCGGQAEGVPCTITKVDGKIMSRPEEDTTADKYLQSTNEHFDEFSNGIKRFEKALSDAIASGKPMSKTQMKEMLDNMKCFRTNSVANLNFLRTRFMEEMGNIVVKAKAEVNSYAEMHLHELGVKCLMDQSDNMDGDKIVAKYLGKEIGTSEEPND